MLPKRSSELDIHEGHQRGDACGSSIARQIQADGHLRSFTVFEHARRFSVPLEMAAVSPGATSALIPTSLPSPAPVGATLAQIYDMARQQATAAIERRKWQALIERLLR